MDSRLTVAPKRIIGLLGACALCWACTMINPAFDEDESATSGPIMTGSEGTTDVGDGESGAEDGESGSGFDGDSGDETGDETETGDGPDIGFKPGAIEVVASFVGCRGTDNFTPAECAFLAGQGQVKAVAIDESSDSGHYLVTCLAFPVDDKLAGKTVTKVTLEMHTINTIWAGSDASGDIWQVEPFTFVDFLFSVPAQVGAQPLASNEDVGKIHAPIEWDLPVDAVAPDAKTYLCAYPLSHDGLYMYSDEGMFPPRLIIDYQ